MKKNIRRIPCESAFSFLRNNGDMPVTINCQEREVPDLYHYGSVFLSVI